MDNYWQKACNFYAVWALSGKHFPTYTKSAAGDFEDIYYIKHTINEGVITEESWKRCDKRRNYSFWEITPFVPMLTIVVCCTDVSIKQGKGSGDFSFFEYRNLFGK